MNRPTSTPAAPASRRVAASIGPDCTNIAPIPKDPCAFNFDPLHVHGVCESKITAIDGDAGVLLLPRLPDRSTGPPEPRGGTADQRRSCRPAKQLE